MKRLLAPLLSAGLAVAPQTAEAGPLLFPGIKQEMMNVFDGDVTCADPVDLEDKSFWVCTDGKSTLTVTEPHALSMSWENPIVIGTDAGYTVRYNENQCVFDRPTESLLGGNQYLSVGKCHQLGHQVRAAIADALNENIPGSFLDSSKN